MAPPKTTDKTPPAAAAAPAPAAAIEEARHVFARPGCALDITSVQDVTKLTTFGDRPTDVAWNCSGDQLSVAYHHCIYVTPVPPQANGGTMIQQRTDWVELLWRPGNDKQMAVLSDDQVILYELRPKNTHTTKWEAQLPGVQTGAWSPEGKALVVVLHNGDLLALSGDTKRTLHKLANKNPNPKHAITCISFRPDGLLVAGTVPSGNIEFIKYSDTAGFSVMGKVPSYNGACMSVATSPDGKLLASGYADATTMLWRTSPITQLAADLQSETPVHALSWTPDSGTLAYTSEDKMAGVFLVDTSNPGSEPVAFLPSCKLPLDLGLGYSGPMAFNPVRPRQIAALYCDMNQQQLNEYMERARRMNGGRGEPPPPEIYRMRVLQLGPAPVTEQARRK